MRLLLDTHAALWAILDDKQLSAKARRLISDEGNEVFVSAVSIWEIAIKHARPRGRSDDIKVCASDAMLAFSNAGYGMLAISPAHAAAVENLPALHADPFDRLLVAQAITEPLILLTRDPKILAYGGTMIAL